jgi:hypothetical protein
MTDWSQYKRCPVCFRNWDCRSVLRSRTRVLARHGAVPYFGSWVVASVGSWGEKSLKKPHKGRAKK